MSFSRFQEFDNALRSVMDSESFKRATPDEQNQIVYALVRGGGGSNAIGWVVACGFALVLVVLGGLLIFLPQ